MVLGAWAKALCDLSRTKCMFEEKLGEALRHDHYSREGAREAIRRYNEHIDKCNRVIEAQEASRAPRLGTQKSRTCEGNWKTPGRSAMLPVASAITSRPS